MRQSDPPVAYLVGTPKGRLSKLEKSLVGLPWHEVRPGIEVKLLAEDDDLYVLMGRTWYAPWSTASAYGLPATMPESRA